MRAFRPTIALVAGFLAMEALVFVAGVLAARSTPRGYFEYFGQEKQELAHALWSTLAFSLPLFIVSALLAWLLGRFLKLTAPSLQTLFAVGVMASFATYLYSSAVSNTAATSPTGALWQAIAAYWPHALWQLPSGPWAGWLGLVAGLALASRTSRHRGAEA